MSENERQQRMVERIQEDERLRGDLEDDAATPLINWAAQRASAAAADPARPDDAVEADVQAVRRAVRAAAASGETDPAKLIDLATAALSVPSASATTSAAPPISQAVPAASAPAAQSPARESTGKPGAAATVARSKRGRGRMAGFLKRLRGGR